MNSLREESACAPQTVEKLAEIRALLEKGSVVHLRPGGVSMLPFLKEGRDSVILEPPRPLKKHDIALYLRAGGRPILHRVVRVKDGVYWFCGDNQGDVERGVPQESVLAVVAAVHRKGKLYNAPTLRYRLYCACLPLLRLYHRCRRMGGRLLRRLGLRKRK